MNFVLLLLFVAIFMVPFVIADTNCTRPNGTLSDIQNFEALAPVRARGDRLKLRWIVPPECSASEEALAGCKFRVDKRLCCGNGTWVTIILSTTGQYLPDPTYRKKWVYGLRPATNYEFRIMAKWGEGGYCASNWSLCNGQTRPPSFILVMTDDQDAYYGSSWQVMANLSTIVNSTGFNGTRFYSSSPLCCPARAITMAGKYCHNTQVYENGVFNGWDNTTYLSGGWPKFNQTGGESDTLPVFLKANNYETFMVGKYLNLYGQTNGTHIPPGWEHWFASCGMTHYYDTKMTNNGSGCAIQNGTYHTTLLLNKTTNFLRNIRDLNRPFFAYVSFFAPHKEKDKMSCVPEPKYEDAFKDIFPFLGPSFIPLSDNGSYVMNQKPAFIRTPIPSLIANKYKANTIHRHRLRCLGTVDDSMAALQQEIENQDMENSTYFLYMSDNGFHYAGEFNQTSGKKQAYQHDAWVPFFMYGAATQQAVESNALMGLADIGPTMLGLASIDIPDTMDGSDFSEFLAPINFNMGENSPPTPPTRDILLVEYYGGVAPVPTDMINSYRSIRADINGSFFLYVEWCTNETELYNLTSDPAQIINLCYPEPPAYLNSTLRILSYVTDRVANCTGVECRNISIANATIPPEFERQPFACVLPDSWLDSGGEGDNTKRALGASRIRHINYLQDIA